MGGWGGRGRGGWTGGGGGEIVLSADPARADYVQSPMHGVHTWPKVLVWTPETLRASQSERDTSVPCCLYLSEDSDALDSHLNVVAELLGKYPELLQSVAGTPETRCTAICCKRPEEIPGAIRRGLRVKPWQAQHCT